jgi:cytosine/adenosine deaminase-related metal-dependent hydrolase
MYSEVSWFITSILRASPTSLSSILPQNTKLLGIQDVAGTLEAGKSADMLILGSNPPDDLAALEDVVHVVYRGNYIEKPAYKKVKALEDYKADSYYEKYIRNKGNLDE